MSLLVREFIRDNGWVQVYAQVSGVVRYKVKLGTRWGVATKYYTMRHIIEREISFKREE